TILAIVLSILLLRWAIILLKQSANVLLESSPVDKKVRQVLLLNPSVDEVVDLHITQITNKMLVASMHLKVRVCNLKEF
ncbi:cation transporter, partial [Campylobacter jejuni]|nr:cation transporter [Campylobacter jejuni]